MAINPVAIRLLNHQLIAPRFDRPEDVVSHLGAMQAQENRLMRWAVALRTKHPSADAFRQAYDSGRIIRVHMHRATWQLVTAEDYGWMRELCGPRGLAGTLGWMHSNKISISDKEHSQIKDILCQVTSDKRSATKNDYEEALADKGIEMDEHRLSYHVRICEFEGELCSGDLLPMRPSYSLVSEKIPHTTYMDRDQSLAMLARKYFQSHSPATLEDFVWWSGLSVSDCRQGMASLGDELRSDPWQGREFHTLESCRRRGFRRGELTLLPSYDEYLIGYKSRDVVLAAEHSHHAHTKNGIFYPVILRDGAVCGNWNAFAKGGIDASFFHDTHNMEELKTAALAEAQDIFIRFKGPKGRF